jgi:hypothetical protein
MRKTKTLLLTALLSPLFLTVAHADPDRAELLKAAQNPLSDIANIPFKNNFNTGLDPSNKMQYIHNVVPVYPIPLNDKWNVITRTEFSIITEPEEPLWDDRIYGLGDTTFTPFFSPKSSGDFSWGVGPELLLPTATNSQLGSDKWGIGPSLLVVKTHEEWVVGSQVSNVWSFAGGGDKDVNFFKWQYFIDYNLGDAWYLTTSPIITADWEEKSDDRWTVPVGGGFGKMFEIFGQYVNAEVGAYNNVISPRGGADWQFRVNFQFMFPSEPEILKEIGF